MADTKRQSIGAKTTTQKTCPPGINELDAALSKAIGAKWVTGSDTKKLYPAGVASS